MEGGKQSLSELPTLGLRAFGDSLEMLLCESFWSLRGVGGVVWDSSEMSPCSSIVYTTLASKQDAV